MGSVGMTGSGDITVIGMDGSPLSSDARAALERATLVVGGARQLRAAELPASVQTITLGKLDPALDALSEHDGPAAVLASGDPGFFGVLRALSEGMGSAPPHVVPGVSSIAAAFARVGLPWDDALVVSMHGAGDGRDLHRAANVCRAHSKVALLTGPGAGAAELARELLGAEQCPAVPARTLVVAARLGEADESVERLTLRQAAARADFPQPHVVLCLADRPDAPRKRWLAGWNGAVGPWALSENHYDHRASQITKAEVRAQAVARLAPSPGSLVWDLGAGSGSVGIECARFGDAVVAVEQDAESCSRISANASAHGVEIAVVQGRAPEILSALPRPDAVFVGGGGVEVVRAALDFAPRQVVVALAAVERVGEVVALLRSDADREVDGVLLQASRLTALPGAAHRLAAQNPVFVLWGDLR
jgi:precorrin-6B C5,15-methyltransferase / cobalt-precorrin-6B C5,C15-methyltransferase